MSANTAPHLPDGIFCSDDPFDNWSERCLYSKIVDLSKQKGYCYCRVVVLGKEMSMSRRTVQRIVKKLHDKNLLYRMNTYSNHQQLPSVFEQSVNFLIPMWKVSSWHSDWGFDEFLKDKWYHHAYLNIMEESELIKKLVSGVKAILEKHKKQLADVSVILKPGYDRFSQRKMDHITEEHKVVEKACVNKSVNVF